jgi:hypothetical protein
MLLHILLLIAGLIIIVAAEYGMCRDRAASRMHPEEEQSS